MDVSRILFSLDHGVIKSTTIVPNYVSEQDLNLLNQKHVSTGLHINLVQGEPLSSAKSFIGLDGEFLNKKTFIRNLLMGRVNQMEIKKEIRAQFEILLDNRVVISHIDSHQNMHFIPQILSCIIKVAEEYHIKKIRALNAEYFWFKKEYSRTKILLKKMVIKYADNNFLDGMKKPVMSILNAPGFGFPIRSKKHALNLWDKALSHKYRSDLIYEISCHLSLSQFEFDFYNSYVFHDLLEEHNVEIGDFNNV
jgi:predicted glycoside hydrolase/deacetylase ChbG (UPF0249 family)